MLGLDLQGGAHLLLEVDSADVTKTIVNNLRDDVRRILREQNVRLTGGIGAQGRTVQFRVPDAGRSRAPDAEAAAIGRACRRLRARRGRPSAL